MNGRVFVLSLAAESKLLPFCFQPLTPLVRPGNSLAEWFLTEPCYNLVYLEVARCQIRQLPANLAVLIPNVRTLNLNFNFISDVQPLQGLARLRKLSLVGSHMQGTKSLIKAVRKMTELELVDFR